MNLQSNVGLVSKLLHSKEFRDAYMFEHIKTGVAYQIRAIRDEHKWTQSRLGEEAKKPRNVISRLEDPNYGQFSFQTLREIASAFNVALLVKFVPFSKLLQEYEDVSSEALVAPSVHDHKEINRLKRWAAVKEKNESEVTSTVDSALYKPMSALPVLPLQSELEFTNIKLQEVYNTGDTTDKTAQTNVISIKTKRPLKQKRVARPRRRIQKQNFPIQAVTMAYKPAA